METAMTFFCLSCIMILSPVLMNLIKHWTKSDVCNLAIPFNRTDLETWPTYQIPGFDRPSVKVAHKMCLFLNGHACSYCEKWLPANKAIFFYCDMRFCSDECRTERMNIDDAKILERGEKACSHNQYTNGTGTLCLV